MDAVVVVNAKTGSTAIYQGKSPEIAVWLAHQQLTLGIENWWEDADSTVRIGWQDNFVVCGEWVARKKVERDSARA